MGVAERRERERAERRERIVDAAEAVFFRLGAVAATMDDVAHEAELSKGTLYLYFRSKDDLYLAIVRRGIAQMVEAAENEIEARERAGTKGAQLLAAVASENRRFGLQHPQHLQTSLAWMASGFRASPDSPGYADYLLLVSRLTKLMVGLVERGQRDGSIRPDVVPFQVVLHLWGGTLGMWLLSFNRDEISRRIGIDYDFDQLVPAYQAMLLRSIGTQEGIAEVPLPPQASEESS